MTVLARFFALAFASATISFATTLEESNKLVELCAAFRPHAAKNYDLSMLLLKEGHKPAAQLVAADFWGVFASGRKCPYMAALAAEMRAKGLTEPDFVPTFQIDPPNDGPSSVYAAPVPQSQIRKELGVGPSVGSKGKVAPLVRMP